MWWRLARPEFTRLKGSGNRRRMKRIVESGEVPGLLAYAGRTPVGWCSVGPRESYPSLERSRILKRVDDRPVWSIVCFFVPRQFRQKGVMSSLIEEAVRYAARRGAAVVEAYPIEPRAGLTPDVFAWTGLASAFRRAGFAEVARRSATRPIMRRSLGPIRSCGRINPTGE